MAPEDRYKPRNHQHLANDVFEADQRHVNISLFCVLILSGIKCGTDHRVYRLARVSALRFCIRCIA